MIQVSTEVANALNQTSRRFDAKIYVNGSAVDCEIMSLKIHKGACGKFTVGSIFIPYVEMTLGGEFRMNAEFELKIAVWLGDDWSEYYRIGYFTPTSIENKRTSTEVYAQGRIANTNDILFSTEPTQRSLQSIYSALQAWCTSKGFSVILKNLTIPSATIEQLLPLKDFSVRDTVELLVACSGGYATEDSNGNIILGKFEHSTPTVINPDALGTYPTFKGTYTLTGIRVVASESLHWDIGGETNFEIQNPYFNAQMVSTFASNTIGFNFSVSDMPISLGDFRFEPWDWVSFSEGGLYPTSELYPSATLYPQASAHAVDVPCLTIDFDFDGGLKTTIKSEGELPEETSAKTAGPISAQLQAAYDKAVAANNLAEQAEQIAEAAYEKAEEDSDTTYTKVMWRHGTSSQGVGAWQDEIPALTSQYPYLWSCIATVTRIAATGQEIYEYGTESKSTLLNGVYAFVSGAADGTTVINGGCLYGGTIVLGGSNNQNGTLEVRTAGGQLTTRLDNSGLYSIAGTIAGFTISNGSLSVGSSGSGAELSSSGSFSCWNGSNSVEVEWGTITQTNNYTGYSSTLATGSISLSGNGTGTFSGGYIDITGSIECNTVGESGYPIRTTNTNGLWLTTTSTIKNTNIGQTDDMYVRPYSTSSRRFKNSIHTMSNERHEQIKGLYDIEVLEWKYNTDYLDEADECYDRMIFGVMSEDIAEVIPEMEYLDKYGESNGYDTRMLVNAMLVLLQDQHKEIESLKERVYD